MTANQAQETEQDTRRILLTPKECGKRALLSLLLTPIFVFFAWHAYILGKDNLSVWGNVAFALWQGQNGREAILNLQRLQRGESVYQTRRSARTEWSALLSILIGASALGWCMAAGFLVNHPHSHSAWRLLSATTGVCGLAIWGLQRLPQPPHSKSKMEKNNADTS